MVQFPHLSFCHQRGKKLHVITLIPWNAAGKKYGIVLSIVQNEADNLLDI
jgi:hypothetical protein